MRPATAALYLAALFLASYANGDAHAYLDPGSGSMMLQALMAGVVAALAVTRMYWDRLKAFVSRRQAGRENLLGD
jgi:hypothetical protein